MAIALGTITAAWIAGFGAGMAALLPLASVARLLPRRAARLEACLWTAVPAAQLAAALAVAVAAPHWAAQPLAYTPHLERPLPHLCFMRAARAALGADFLRAASVAVVLLLVAAAVRLTIALTTSRRSAAGAVAGARILHNPFCDRAFVASGKQLAVTIGLLRPVVVLDAKARELDAQVLGAVLAHEAAHARWRDPLVGTLVETAAWLWPVPGAIVARMWRRAAERAADVEGKRRAGPEAWAKARATLAEWADDPPDAHRPDRAGPAIAAAGAWALLIAALAHLFWQPAVLSVICAFEAFAAAWQ